MRICIEPDAPLISRAYNVFAAERSKPSISPRLLLLLLPLLLLPMTRLMARPGPNVSSASSESQPPAPPIVRQHLERALGGVAAQRGTLSIWRATLRRGGDAPLWSGEQRCADGSTVRAYCEETRGDVILCSREQAPIYGKERASRVVHDLEAVKRAVRRHLQILGKPGAASWKMTAVYPPKALQLLQGDPTWLVQGVCDDAPFQMRLDPATDTLIIYVQSRPLR